MSVLAGHPVVTHAEHHRSIPLGAEGRGDKNLPRRETAPVVEARSRAWEQLIAQGETDADVCDQMGLAASRLRSIRRGISFGAAASKPAPDTRSRWPMRRSATKRKVVLEI
jgi:hypothetical protein